MYQNESILENKNEIKKFNKLKITHYFQSYSKLLMKSLGIKTCRKDVILQKNLRRYYPSKIS